MAILRVKDEGIWKEIQAIKGEKGDTGEKGPQGEPGQNGVGIKTGGIAGQVLMKASSNDFDTKWFALKAVDDLVNYYRKNETYTQAEVNALISVIPKFSIEVVNTLPIENISETTIYLLVEKEQETGNLYAEYIYVNNNWEMLGTQKVDLTGYATEQWTTEQINLAINDFVQTEWLMLVESLAQQFEEINTELETKQDVLTAGDNITIENNVISATGGGEKEIINASGTSSNPFILNTLKRGDYVALGYAPYVKYEDTSAIQLSSNIALNGVWLVVDNDVTKGMTLIRLGQRANSLNTSDGYKNIYARIILKKSGTTLYGPTGLIPSEDYYIGYSTLTNIDANSNQTITGIKTFNTLPVSSETPTTNNQFTNKSYVDNLVASNDKLTNKHIYILDNVNYPQSAPLMTNTLKEGDIIIAPANNKGYLGYDTYTCIVGYEGWNVTAIVTTADDGSTKMDPLVMVEFLNTHIRYHYVYLQYGAFNDHFGYDVADYEMKNFLNTDKNQTITGIKTFSSLPIANDQPTENNQLVNKSYVDNLKTTYTGYDATKTQVLKNINGTLTWVDE